MNNVILIIDFGSQVTQLIARRLRELHIYCEIYAFGRVNAKTLKNINPKAIILSGSPESVSAQNAPKIDEAIFELAMSDSRDLLWATAIISPFWR